MMLRARRNFRNLSFRVTRSYNQSGGIVATEVLYKHVFGIVDGELEQASSIRFPRLGQVMGPSF